MNRLFVVAHYDPEGILDSTFLDLMDQIKPLATKVIVVSTGLLDTEKAKLADWATVLVRPNLGYDFGSWRVAIEHARRTMVWAALDEVIVVNSSFYLLRENAIQHMFDAMEGVDTHAWSCTASDQARYHLQSYFVVFRKKALRSAWFARFWSSIWEYSDRDFAIWSYEMTLASSAIEAGVNVKSFYYAPKDPHAPFGLRDTNPTHYLWERVAETAGVAKVELIRNNPHELSLKKFASYTTPERFEAILAHAKRTNAAKPPARAGQPEQLDEMREYAEGSSAPVAVHMHIHYPELAPELLAAASNIAIPYDLFITMSDASALKQVVDVAKSYRPEARVILLENHGRDILPFLELLQSGVFAPYQAVCKLHSKRSRYSDKGDMWRDMLVSQILGSPSLVLDILDAFRDRPKLGMVVPHSSFVRNPTHWGANQERATRIARDLYADKLEDLPIAFPAGSMYWLRPAAFAAFKHPAFAPSAFEPESGAQDGTMAHVVERLTAIFAWSEGYEIASSDDLAGSVSAEGADTAIIPVLDA